MKAPKQECIFDNPFLYWFANYNCLLAWDSYDVFEFTLINTLIRLITIAMLALVLKLLITKINGWVSSRSHRSDAHSQATTDSAIQEDLI